MFHKINKEELIFKKFSPKFLIVKTECFLNTNASYAMVKINARQEQTYFQKSDQRFETNFPLYISGSFINVMNLCFA